MSAPVIAKLAYNRQEAAAALGVSERRIDELRRNGDLVARKLGSTILFPASELERYVESLPLHS